MKLCKPLAIGLATFAIGLSTFPAKADEQIDLSAPRISDPTSTSNLKIVSLTLDREKNFILIRLGANGVYVNFIYVGSVARTLMNQLNTANLTNNSLHRRIIQRLINDGKLSGDISGTPD